MILTSYNNKYICAEFTTVTYGLALYIPALSLHAYLGGGLPNGLTRFWERCVLEAACTHSRLLGLSYSKKVLVTCSA